MGLHRPAHRYKVLRRHIWLYVVHGPEDQSTTQSQSSNDANHLSLHLSRGAERQDLLGVDRPMEYQICTKIALQALHRHPSAAGLYRVENLDAVGDQVWDETPDG